MPLTKKEMTKSAAGALRDAAEGGIEWAKRAAAPPAVRIATDASQMIACSVHAPIGAGWLSVAPAWAEDNRILSVSATWAESQQQIAMKSKTYPVWALLDVELR
jgi:hypothetical protein